jgi:SPP1 family predicted phage head-tail adaptor
MGRGNNYKRYPSKSLSTETRGYAFIQSKNVVDDGRGGQNVTWENTTLEPHAMAFIPMRAKQVFEYKSLNVEASHVIKIRGEIEVSELNRIVWDGRVFEILTVEDVQERGVVKWLTTIERRV